MRDSLTETGVLGRGEQTGEKGAGRTNSAESAVGLRSRGFVFRVSNYGSEFVLGLGSGSLTGSEQLQSQLPLAQHDSPPSSTHCPSTGFVQKRRFGVPAAERRNWSKKPLQQHPKLQSKHATSPRLCCGLRGGAGDAGTGCGL